MQFFQRATISQGKMKQYVHAVHYVRQYQVLVIDVTHINVLLHVPESSPV